MDELNEYDEDVQKVIGIFAPHLGADHIHETSTTQSPVNNCGEVQTGLGQSLPPTPSEYATAVMKLVESGDVRCDEPDVAKVLGEAVRQQSPSVNHQQQSFNPSKARELAPSSRLTKHERAKIPQIYRDLVSQGITPERWVLEALARGASVMFDRNKYLYLGGDEWPGFSGQP